MWRGGLAAGLLALFVVPSAAAQLDNPSVSTPTTLYFHIFDTYNVFPVNTQPMQVDFFQVSGSNFPTIAAQGYDFNTIRGFSTSGPVEYGFLENGRPRFHPERGIAADVKLDPAVAPTGFLYLDVRDFLGSDTQGLGLPQVLPAFTVRITMRAGNQIGPDADLDAGTLIMEGATTAHVVDTQMLGANGQLPKSAPDGTPILTADQEGVVEFAVPMVVAQPTIPKADSFNLRIDWYQNPTGDPSLDDQFSEGWLRLVLDSKHLPRLQMAVLDPVYIEFIHPQVAAGTLLVHAGVNSPWGTYDVDVGNVSLAITGPSQPQSLARVVSQNAHVHGLHDKAAEVTWLWRFRDENAPSGDYSIELKVPNLAHTAMADGKAKFTIAGQKAYGQDEQGQLVEPVQDPGAKSSPAAGLLPIAVLLAWAWAARRPR